MAKRKTKEYYTITLDGIPVRMLGEFLRETLGMSAEKIENSHFYAVGSGDFTYSDALDLDAYFAERHSATLHIKKIRFDREYREAQQRADVLRNQRKTKSKMIGGLLTSVNNRPKT